DIAAGPEAEPCAAIVEQVEFSVAAAANELVTALLGRPPGVHPRPYDRRKDREKRFAHRPDKGEIAVPVAAREIIEENPAGAARLATMRQIEILVAPGLEAGVAIGVVARARRREGAVEFFGGRGIGVDRGEVGAAAEPGFCG